MHLKCVFCPTSLLTELMDNNYIILVMSYVSTCTSLHIDINKSEVNVILRTLIYIYLDL